MVIEFLGDLDVGDATHVLFPNLQPKTPEYRDIGATFTASLGRVIALGWLPAELTYWSALYAVAGCEAKSQLGLEILPDTSGSEFEEKMDSILAQISPFNDQDPSQAGRNIFLNGHSRLKIMLQQTKHIGAYRHRRQALEALLSAMITGAYAALEAMATDLWIAAVNRHPSLASKYTEKSGDKQISYSVIRGYGFDLRTSMGKILFENKRVSFQSFYDIKSAYQDAFGEDFSDVFKDIDSVVCAEKIRHLIAHRGGLIDAKFKNEMKNFADYSDLSLGEMLPLNGPMAREQIDSCAKFGTALFNAVDNWSALAGNE